MSGHYHQRTFGKPARQHVLILASGETIRHVTLKPWMVWGLSGLIGVFTFGFLAATTYLALRDDLISGSMARQFRMEQEYEDRIASLRAQVDRVTSRQMLDQQLVEQKVDKLLQQQMELTNRHGKLGNVLDRAEQSGVSPAQAQPAPATDGLLGSRADAGSPGRSAMDLLLGKDMAGSDSHLTAAAFRETDSDRADRLFTHMTLALKAVEHDQIDTMRKLTADAHSKAGAIEKIIGSTGVELETAEAKAKPVEPMGGPFIEPVVESSFNQSLTDLDGALSRLESLRAAAKRLPYDNPAPGHDVTSRFGNRLDPFFNKPAFHPGMDFRFAEGDKIRPSGIGTVSFAGNAGGYGNMVEVDHGDGLVTRYGHLSKIIAKQGDKVTPETVIGLAGSTGRSTGTHLHYEVRLNDEAVDPMDFLNAGMKLTSYLR